MRRRATALAGLLLVGLVAGCSSNSDQTTQSPAAGQASLTDTEWQLSGAPLATQNLIFTPAITITFSTDSAAGFAGVNQYNGSFTSSTDGALSFGPLASTQMAGSETAMAAETEYLATLPTVDSYTSDGSTLHMFAKGTEVLTYETNQD